MRGYFHGAFWALFIGTIVVSIVSYLDDRRTANEMDVADQLRGLMGALDDEASAEDAATPPTATEIELSEVAPAAQTDMMASLSSVASDTAPVIVSNDIPPFTDPWVPVLANTARLPELPLLDGDSTPDAVPDPVPAATTDSTADVVAPPPPPAPLAEPDAETAPAVETDPAEATAPVPAPAQPPVILEETDTAAEAAASAEEATPRVVINRPSAAPTETAGQAAEVIAEEALDEDAPALLRYAAAFENPDRLPVLAILIVDDGQVADASAIVANLGFPATIVVDALSPDAATRVQAYREAGAEVAIALALPPGALPSDVEVAFEAALGLMPEVAMLYSSGGDVVQGNRQVTSQVMAVLGASGMGFVAQERGLGGAIRAAEQAGVAAVPITRDLDGNGESSGAITRALDQAAFRARQTGDAVLLARLNEATLATLRDWAAANAGAGTVIGPVSAVLSVPEE